MKQVGLRKSLDGCVFLTQKNPLFAKSQNKNKI
jgi:hypothetical protein